jgi:pyruvate dehydrogenase E1 component
MSNLGGHDMASMLDAFESIDHDRPVCFIAYTIKGVACRSRATRTTTPA